MVTGISRTPESGNRCHGKGSGGYSYVLGIYGKGSAFKEWSSPLDYVPEISDLDIHIRVASHHTLLLFHQDLDFALRFQNQLEKNPEYIAAPPGTVNILHGIPYIAGDYKDGERLKELSLNSILGHQGFLSHCGREFFDKTGKYNFLSLRYISWRIGPLSPQLLTLEGYPPHEAWSHNRTQAIGALEELGMKDVAGALRGYYSNSRDYFLSRYLNVDKARMALKFGYQANRLAFPNTHSKGGNGAVSTGNAPEG